MTQVPSIRTPVSLLAAVEAFWFAHQDVIGGFCETLLLETLTIQFDVECAGGDECFDYDLGNMRGAGDIGTQAIRGANEIIGGKVVTGSAVEGGFAAFSSARAGAQAMIKFLGVASHPPLPNRFAGAWEAAKIGDLPEYAHQLSKDVQGPRAYFTANTGVYAAGLLSRRPRCRAAVDTFLVSLQPEPDRV